jgi:hypothetical protein
MIDIETPSAVLVKSVSDIVPSSFQITVENEKVQATDIVAEKPSCTKLNTNPTKQLSLSKSQTSPTVTVSVPSLPPPILSTSKSPTPGPPPPNITSESAHRISACERFGVGPSPINVPMFAHLLSSHPDRQLVSELLHDLTEGVRIGYNGPRDKFRPSPNLPILPEHESFVDSEIQKEVDSKRRIGPFDKPPFDNFIISPIGVVTKRLSSKLRMIHHLSWPRHQSADSDSINEHISPEDSETQLQSFDDAVHILAGLNPKLSKSDSIRLIKLDVKGAYRLVFIHPDDWHCIGMQWKGKYYFDPFLVFGLSSACRHWERVATAVHWIAQHEFGIELMVHYIDDYLVICVSNDVAEIQLKKLCLLFKSLGIPLAHEKTEGPTSELTFLGIQINALTMTISIDPPRLVYIQSTLSDWMKKSQASIKEFQSLIGVLNFCCKVIRPGRIFLRRLINWCMFLSHKFKYTSETKPHPISGSVKKDISWWLTYVNEFNGKMSVYPTVWCNYRDMNIATDACVAGYGGVFNNQYFYGKWSVEESKQAQRIDRDSMPWKELHTLVRAASTWGNRWTGKNIVFQLDCQPMVFAVDKGGSRDPEIMSLIRTLSYLAAKHHFNYKVEHIPGRKNVGPDLLSRGDVKSFLEAFQHLNLSLVHALPLPCHTW